MKTKQTKIDRYGAKWLQGGAALAAAGASSQAATVQITLIGNQISLAGNQLVADLTGDSIADITITDDSFIDEFGSNAGAFANINGGLISAQYFITASTVRVDAQFAASGVGDPIVGSAFGSQTTTTTYLNPITFMDMRINGGAETQGFLEVSASIAPNSPQIALTRLIFDDESTTRPIFGEIPGTQTEWSAVPEPSSIALLALGAGGLAFRRSRKKAA